MFSGLFRALAHLTGAVNRLADKFDHAAGELDAYSQRQQVILGEVDEDPPAAPLINGARKGTRTK